MITFKEYLHEKYLEEAKIDMNKLNMDFIRKAEIITSFNIPTKEYEYTRYKSEIQFLFTKHFFPNFDVTSTLKTFKPGPFNNLVKNLKAENFAKFQSLFKYQPKGIGPGEILMYFLIDDVTLGGGSSAGLDITSGGKGYEVKAASLGKDGFFYGFKVGGTVNISGEIKAASNIKKSLGFSGRETEINKSQIQQIKKSRYANEWIERVEIPYTEKVSKQYFGNHDTIFLINESPKAQRGEAFVKKVKPTDVELEVVTGGTIKPRVKL